MGEFGRKAIILSMLRRSIFILSLIGILISLWPQARSLRDLTGEEALPGQLIGVLHWFNTATRPQPDLALDADVQHVDVSPFGMNVFVQNEPSIDVREGIMRTLNEAGFRFIRQQFVWEDIEIAGKGDFVDRRNDPNGVDAWAKYDNIVDLAERYDIEIIARLDNPPAWSRAAGNEAGTYAPPDDYNDFGDFVAAVVERYAGHVTYFQLWNEPNGNGEWGVAGPNPEQFTEMLCLGYERAKEANPEAVIVGPALTPTRDISNQNFNDLIFMQRVYAAGGGDCFDVMAAQGYGLRSGASDQRLQWTRINFAYHQFLRDMMVANGDAEKAIWISETGWNAIPDGIVPEGMEPFGQVTLEEQADYAVALYERVQSDWPWIGVANYWFLKEAVPKPDQPFYYFRAMEPDFTPLPAWEALAAYVPNDVVERESKEVWGFRPILFQLSAFTTIVSGLQLAMTTTDLGNKRIEQNGT